MEQCAVFNVLYNFPSMWWWSSLNFLFKLGSPNSKKMYLERLREILDVTLRGQKHKLINTIYYTSRLYYSKFNITFWTWKLNLSHLFTDIKLSLIFCKIRFIERNDPLEYARDLLKLLHKEFVWLLYVITTSEKRTNVKKIEIIIIFLKIYRYHESFTTNRINIVDQGKSRVVTQVP